jgi:hypothetical protein
MTLTTLCGGGSYRGAIKPAISPSAGGGCGGCAGESVSRDEGPRRPCKSVADRASLTRWQAKQRIHAGAVPSAAPLRCPGREDGINQERIVNGTPSTLHAAGGGGGGWCSAAAAVERSSASLANEHTEVNSVGMKRPVRVCVVPPRR